MITGADIQKQMETEVQPGAETVDAQCERLGIDKQSVQEFIWQMGLYDSSVIGFLVIGVELERQRSRQPENEQTVSQDEFLTSLPEAQSNAGAIA